MQSVNRSGNIYFLSTSSCGLYVPHCYVTSFPVQNTLKFDPVFVLITFYVFKIFFESPCFVTQG